MIQGDFGPSSIKKPDVAFGRCALPDHPCEMFKTKMKAVKRSAEKMGNVVEEGGDRDGRKGKRRRRRSKKAKGRKKCD